MQVSPTGSKAQQQVSTVLANALAITDAVTHFYNGGSNWTTGPIAAILDWNKYNRHALMVVNSHNQPINISLLSNLRGGTTGWDILKSNAGTSQAIPVPAGGTFVPILITKSDIAALDGIQTDEVSMLISAATAPTSGSITIKLIQWAE